MAIPPFGSPPANINKLLPTQTGNSGKFLTTNGTTPSWATVSGFAVATPTTMQSNLTLPPHTQMLYRQPIIVGSYSVILGTDSSLVSV